jgi:endoglucanase
LASADFGVDTQAKLMTGTYDTDWTYPSANEAAYFKGKGMNMVRIPFRWERMQPTLNAPLDANELGRLKGLVSGVTGNGMTVLLDVHNYARWGFDSNISSQTNLIGTAAVPVSAFVDLWARLATEFKGNPNVMFGLMNEPHEIDVTTWVSAANQAIVAIRATGATNTITVGGVSWTGAWSWTNSTWKSDGTYNGDSNAVAMLNVTDSGNNLLFEVHQYLDKNYSGIFDTTIDPTSSNDCVYDYTTTLVKFTTWLKVNNKKGLLGEIGAPSTAACDKAVADALSYVQANADVWAGWMWWAAGPWWGNNYKLSLEPTWSGDYKTGTAVADKPQMSVLTPYLK